MLSQEIPSATGIQQIEGYCILVCTGQISHNDHILFMFPDIHTELSPDCGHVSRIGSPVSVKSCAIAGAAGVLAMALAAESDGPTRVLIPNRD